MPKKDAQNSIYAKQCSCKYPKPAKHIIDIRGMSVFECPGDSPDLKPIQEDLNTCIMKMA